MNRQFSLVTIFVVAMSAFCSCRNRDDVKKDASRVLNAQEEYSLTAEIEIVKPVKLEDLNTEWQSAKIVRETNNTVVLSVTVRPFFDQLNGLTPNRKWKSSNAADRSLAEFLAPAPTADWDEDMRST